MTASRRKARLRRTAQQRVALRRVDRAVVQATVMAIALGACSSVSTVRIQPEAVHVGPNLRPIAIIHAQVTSAYVLFIPIPGHVDLDRVVNRMLLATAKALGADKVVNIHVDLDPDGGIWAFRKILGWRSAKASGVAVIVEEPPPVKAAPMASETPKP